MASEPLQVQLKEAEECLARDRQVIAELINTIVKYVPRKHWPRFVLEYYGAILDNLLGGPQMKSEKEKPLGEGVEKGEAEVPSVKKTSSRKMRIDWSKQPLGKVPDTDIARKLEISSVTVGRERNKRGILAFRPGPGQRRCGRRAGINWDNQPLLGKVPDSELAKELGVHAATVRGARVLREKRAAEAEAQEKAELAAPPPAIEEAPPEPPKPQPPPAPRPKPKPRPAPGRHRHRCPVCREEVICMGSSCEPKLETDQEELMSYRTCEACIKELSKESSGKMIHVSGKFEAR